MEARIRDLEKGHAVVVERISGLDRHMDDGFKAMTSRFDDINRRLDDLGRKIDKLPDRWATARVVIVMTGALTAAVLVGPRLMSMIGN